MANLNPNCCGGHCRTASGEVRVYPLGSGGNLILCSACFEHENAYRRVFGKHYGRPEEWPEVDWTTAERYPEPRASEPGEQRAARLALSDGERPARQPYCEYVGTSPEEPPMCEQCGEEPASIKTAEAGLCYDCFTAAASEHLTALLGYRPCGMLVWQAEGEGQTAVCLVPHGIEHAH